MTDAFVRHEPCPNCGSKDNLARYKSGSCYCFGCGYNERSKKPVFKTDTELVRPLTLPGGCTTEYSNEVMLWVNQYGLGAEELLKNNVLYNSYWDQLIFPFYDADKRVVLWQARNFEQFRKQQRKYFTQGDVAAVLPIYKSSDLSGRRVLAVVEDCVSAIKLARHVDTMPALSSSIPKEKLARLRYLYDTIIFWLDGNMYNNAVKLVKQAELLGFAAHAVYTVDDPKLVCRSEMAEIINTTLGLTQ